ncbi:MAG TPA: ABC transporter ATP-binding protein [Actinomycetota bacterium]|nr:ABC transporter ATP-binding protein [Actinomycetota bacterium]
MPDVLQLRDISLAYAAIPVLDSVNLTVAEGEVLALLGPSGSGKSTLLNAVAGFLPLRSGEIFLRQRRVATVGSAEPPEKREIALVFQDYGLWPHLTALDTVAYPLRRRGVRRDPARAEAQQLLDRLGVGQLASRKPAQLSGGEQQRVGLARAMARQAALYLFDEPTAHLDAQVRDVFLAELAARRRELGAAAIYATHDAAEALGLADRVALLVDGRVIQVGTPQQVYAQPINAAAARLTGPVSLLAGSDVAVLVRPDWAKLGGDRTGIVADVWFRGSYTDYVLDTPDGQLQLRAAGFPAHRRGEEVSWSLDHSWTLPGD